MDRYYKIEDIGSRRSDLRKKAIFKGIIRLCFSGRLAFFPRDFSQCPRARRADACRHIATDFLATTEGSSPFLRFSVADSRRWLFRLPVKARQILCNIAPDLVFNAI